MHVSKSVEEWLAWRRSLDGRSVGVVPTMGALHRGHGSLVERCRRENDITIVSIFVNPTQFNDPRDLQRYPRTMEQDLALLHKLGADGVFAPDATELYPQSSNFHMEEQGITQIMEGKHRPGFFPGVMTVVLKLLNLVRADRAYFGEKDYQQLKLISELTRHFFIGTEIVPCPTVREPSGLAESSRNALLSAPARQKAAAIYRALSTAPDCMQVRACLESQGFTVDYVEEHWGRRFAAAHLEGVRLIDNVALGGPR